MVQVILNGEEAPIWLVQGRTQLILKTAEPSEDSKNYCPITCLNTMYKLLMATVGWSLKLHVEQYGLMYIEQCVKLSNILGTMDCLVIDHLVTS